MALFPTSRPAAGSARFWRFRELVFVSVAGHLVFAAFYALVLHQWTIAMALGLPSLLVAALYPLVSSPLPMWKVRWLSHTALLINFAGLNLAMMWMGLKPHDAIWWEVWWPMFVAHLLGVADGLVWVLLALVGAALIWFNDGAQWVPPLMPEQDNPILLMQVGFLMIGAGFGLVVRRAHDRYECDIEQQQATIADQQQSLQGRARKLEDTLQAFQQAKLDRTRLFAQISHEVRTPLNGLMGFTQLLARSSLDEHQSRHVAQIQQCGGDLLHIVNEMLDFSRLEAHPTALDCRAFNPIDVAHEAVDMMAPLAEQKALSLRCEFSDQDCTLMGDPLRLKQVLLNLLANALKFTAHGHITVRCQVQARADGQQALKVEVQDSGIGIPAEVMAHLFQPFNLASDRTIAQYGGSGLGLAICKRLVDLMQGHIGVDSQTGRGCRFWFEVPLKGA